MLTRRRGDVERVADGAVVEPIRGHCTGYFIAHGLRTRMRSQTIQTYRLMLRFR